MYYFAYASNLSKQRMREQCPGCRPKFTAVLPGYRMVFTGWSREWRGGKATIRASHGDKVRGAVYDVGADCIRKMDRTETGYEKLNVTVFSEDNQPVPVVTYIKTGKSEEAPPSEAYLAVIRQGYQDWGLV